MSSDCMACGHSVQRHSVVGACAWPTCACKAYSPERVVVTAPTPLAALAVLDLERATPPAAPTDGEAHRAVATLLRYIGEDPTRDGLADTPRRVAKALRELTRGMGQDPASVLTTSFESGHDQMIVVPGIRFVSLCEHHLLPFVGTATVAYLPNGGRIVGLSKLPRLVELMAARPQVQERLTDEVADVLEKAVDCGGVAVRIVASHACAALRGVRQPDMSMVTTRLTGAFLANPETRAEFLALCR